MKTRAPLFTIALIVLAIGAPSLWAQDGLAGAISRIRNARGLLDLHCGQGFVAADFDNDHKPDGAILLHFGNLRGRQNFRIELHDSAHKVKALSFASKESSLSIRALDVNRDGATDIVVEQAFTHKHLKVWLNDGHGSFYSARVEDFRSEDDGSPPQFDAPPDDQHGPALLTIVKRCTKLILQRALSSSNGVFSPRPNSWSFISLIQEEASGPHPSRAPPISSFSL